MITYYHYIDKIQCFCHSKSLNSGFKIVMKDILMQKMNILKDLNQAKIRPLENLEVLRYKTEQTRGIKDNFPSKQYLNFK